MTTSQCFLGATFPKKISSELFRSLFRYRGSRAPLPRCESHLVPVLFFSLSFQSLFANSSPAVSLLLAFLSSLPFLSFSSSGLSCFWGLFGLSLPRCVVSGFAHLVARVAPSGTPSSLGVPDAASLIEHPIQQALVGSNWRPGIHLIPAGLQFQPPNNQPA